MRSTCGIPHSLAIAASISSPCSCFVAERRGREAIRIATVPFFRPPESFHRSSRWSRSDTRATRQSFGRLSTMRLALPSECLFARMHDAHTGGDAHQALDQMRQPVARVVAIARIPACRLFSTSTVISSRRLGLVTSIS